MKILAVEFNHPVRFPHGADGAGRNFERFISDGPNAIADYTMYWDEAAKELVVQNTKCGLTVGVRESNIAYTRPAVGGMARKLEAEYAARGAKR